MSKLSVYLIRIFLDKCNCLIGLSTSDLHPTPEIDATLSPAIAFKPTEVIERTKDHLHKTVDKEPCEDCQSPVSGKSTYP